MSNATLISHYLKNNFPIEQIKYNMYIEDDIYHRIPVLVFRFSQDLNKSIYDELKESVESFQGKVSWTVFESFYGKKVRNYLLCPIEVYEMQRDLYEKRDIMSEKEYFTDGEFKNLCDKGVEDMPNLFMHIKENFKPNIILGI